MELIADTTLLVGLWRKQNWAMNFAHFHSKQRLGIPWVVLGEFWHGAKSAGHDVKYIEEFLSLGVPIYDAESAVPYYAKVCAQLRKDGFYKQIGQNDLWIAAVCLSTDLPLVTKNERHFRHIQKLRLQPLINF